MIGITGYQISRRPSFQTDLIRGKFRWLQETRIATVLDVGANTGQFAVMARQLWDEAMIYSFEPLASCYMQLCDNTSTLQPIRCFPIALGEHEGSITMQKNDFSPSSSILKLGEAHAKAFPFAVNVVEEEVKMSTLDAVSRSLDLSPGVLLKIDVQGYELQVLRGGRATLPHIELVIVETSFVELYEGQPLFWEVYQLLHEYGFHYVGALEQLVDPASGAILQADSIFRNARAV